jgi:alkylation response protein AidB-like acyl-CoA dehydrogenase
MWSTNAHLADYGLCLARSNWDVPKHEGLSLVMVPLKETEGVTVRRTRMADGTLGDVCEEFFDDVLLPADNLIGEEGEGWSVAQTLLHHERNQTAGIGYGYLGGVGRHTIGVPDPVGRATALVDRARERGSLDEHAQALGTAYVDALVSRLTSDRIMRGMALGTHTGPWGSLGKLLSSEAVLGVARAELAVLGTDGVVVDGADPSVRPPATAWLTTRTATIGGGTSEIQRNIVGERLLGLPREPSVERGRSFAEVLRAAARAH